MLNEPVRGVMPEPSFFSLSGLEQLRAFTQGRMPSTPNARLFGYRVTQVSSGTAVISQPISPWFQVNEGYIDLTSTAELSVYVAALTAAPPGVYCQAVNLSIRYLRPCTVESETITARGRILHAGSSFTTVESLIEDGLGRAVAHATGSVVMAPMEPPPPALTHPLEPVEEPVYTTPDPFRRPLSQDSSGLGTVAQLPRGTEQWRAAISDPTALSPLYRFFGCRVLEVSEGYGKVSLPSSEWFCRTYREVAPGIIGTVMSFAGGLAILTLAEPGQRLVVINQTTSFISPVLPDGRDVIAVASVRGARDGVLVSDVEAIDADGRTVLVGQATGMFSARHTRSGQRIADRVLLSVLFTDLVGSTERVSELGDEAWSDLLDQHHTLVRRQLELHKGREVKTAGDGFLATFESPTRAVRCAAAIRDGVERLGLKIRAGIHTGECDVAGGDVAGVAVHVASRVQSAAQPSEVLVSATVRDLVAGSGFALVDRGARELKGLDGEWTLFAVE